MSRFLKVPSPATVMAALALFVSLGGTAWAVKQIGTNQIKNNAVTTNKIRNKAVTPGKSSMMWALVRNDGTIIKSSGGVTVASPVSAGNLYIKFPRSVKGRVILASQQFSPDLNNESVVAAAACGGDLLEPVAGQIECVQSGYNTSRDVYVSTYRDNGVGEFQSVYVMVW